ncbi:MAG: PadR family transcriptional regulator [Halothermotrichaceae bacterium]
MSKKNDITDYLPLTEATYYIMLSLVEPLHGYGIMQKAEEISKGRVVLAPGTLYGALSKLEDEDLITMVKAPVQEDSRRKYYGLTKSGRTVLKLEYERIKQMTRESKSILEKMEETNNV